MAKIIASIEFENEVLKSDVPVLVDFYANWCGPCKKLAPTIDEISDEVAGKAKVVKFDVDTDKEFSKSHEIKSIPTLMFFKNGELKERVVGGIPKEDILAKLNQLY